ncbi:hypothetical protein [Desulfurivibrio dismutans]|uniref:hypothetical protein n=1 Tax=Desulfurivibrio dismutans TaxID=1398908 RepID=UPI0023DCAA55|nr:hypothetical protein [Desulfurivibrio alkaliphilus]MDF1614735.1 hypothetical protein [Desulfurivibrio alkaliphilus]
MMKAAALILLVMLLAGCALPARPPEPSLQASYIDIAADALWRVTISQGEERKFSGLLGTRRENGGLHYVLLDGTGVTLLAARLSADGEMTKLRQLGVFDGHRLPDFLATSLYRIFLLEPAATPCSRNFLLQLCRRETAQGEKKYARAGFLPWWSVEYVTAAEESQQPGITFKNTWLGVTLQLVAD